MHQLTDSYERKMDYLRISVTDRCNFRCQYCVPEDIKFQDKSHILSLEEMLTFAKACLLLSSPETRWRCSRPIREGESARTPDKGCYLPGRRFVPKPCERRLGDRACSRIIVSQEKTRVRIELWAEALYDPALAKIFRRGRDDTVRSIEMALGERENGSGSPKTPLGEAHALAFLWSESSPWRTLSDVSWRTGQRSQ